MLVSVVIPTHNRRDYVCHAIDSVLRQTYAYHEILVVDDGSTDGTGSLLRDRYALHEGGPVQYFYQENRGESGARNEAIRRSRGEYIALLDSDDEWLPTKLQRQVAFLDRQSDVGLVSCHALLIDAGGKLLQTTPLRPEQVEEIVTIETLVLDSPMYCSSLLMRRSCLERVGLFDESIRYGEDWDLVLRFAAEYQIGFVQEPLVLLRQHLGQQSRHRTSLPEAERRLADQLGIAERILAHFQGDAQLLTRLEAKARAREYARAAISDYLHARYERGKSRLRKAAELDPDTWRDGEQVSSLLLEYAISLAAEGRPSTGIDLIERAYAHLPADYQEWAGRFRRRTLGQAHGVLMFMYQEAGTVGLVRKHALRAITYKPSWLSNTGVISITAEAFGGARLAGIGRRMFRNLLSRQA